MTSIEEALIPALRESVFALLVGSGIYESSTTDEDGNRYVTNVQHVNSALTSVVDRSLERPAIQDLINKFVEDFTTNWVTTPEANKIAETAANKAITEKIEKWGKDAYNSFGSNKFSKMAEDIFANKLSKNSLFERAVNEKIEELNLDNLEYKIDITVGKK